MAQSFSLPLRWTGALPAGDLAPLNCLYGGGAGMPALTGAQIPKGAQWPSVRVNKRGGAEAGPTGAPWLNANGWLIRRARHLDAAKPVVIDAPPPAGARPGSYVLAAAEAMAYGAAWAVTHTPETWPAVRVALQFFEAHAEWRGWAPVAALTVISDFTGEDEFIGEEFLNLLTRRQVGLQLAAPGNVAALGSVGAAVWASKKPVPYAQYLPWIRGGGTFIVQGEANSRVEGKGRVIGRPEEWEDVYAAVTGTHLAMTRRTDVLRLWNAGSFNCYYQAAPDGKRAVAQLINYAGNRSSDDTSIWLARPWKSATLTTFDQQTPLKPRATNGGIELSLPPLGVYAAIELEA
jgi:hypothetical protein